MTAADNTHISFSHEDIRKVEAFASSQKSSVLVIFFDDIKGSSLIKQKMARTEGEEAFQKLRREHDQVLAEIISREGLGEVIKSTGDGLLAVFTEPTTAVERALEIQAYYRNHPYISLRIGMDMGQVRVEKFGGVQKDMFGRHVDWASRAEAMAEGGHILVTESVYNDASDWVKRNIASWKSHGHYFLKPGERPFALFEPYNANLIDPMDHPRGTAAGEQAGDRPGKSSAGKPEIKRARLSPALLALAVLVVMAIGGFAYYQMQKPMAGQQQPRPVKNAVAADRAISENRIEYPVSGAPIPIGCDSGAASQTLARESTGIHWVWKDKKSIYCGFLLDRLPVTKFSPAAAGPYYLEIIYTGSYKGAPAPQVKLIDIKDRHSALLTFSDYESDAGKGKRRIWIPIRDFTGGKGMENTVKMIQFDAGWDSPEGDLYLLSIKFVKQE